MSPKRRSREPSPPVLAAAVAPAPEKAVAKPVEAPPAAPHKVETAADVDAGPQIEAHEIPMPRRGSKQRMVTLTLLDGTKVNLPAKPTAAKKPRLPSDPPATETKPTPSAAGEGLTARDLSAALRAVAHGADASEILGENVRWEALFSALLSLMLKKHLIADWEFVEEYKKI